MGGGVLAHQQLVLHALLVDGSGHGGPVDGAEVGAVGVARLGGGALHGLHGLVEAGHVLVVQSHALRLGGGLDGVDKAHGLHRLLLEELIPGLVVGVVLALEGGAGVQHAQGGVQVAVLAVQEALVGLLVVKGGLRHGVALPADGDGGLPALDDPGVVDQQRHGHHHEQPRHHAVEDIAPALGGALLGGAGGLGVRRAGGQ